MKPLNVLIIEDEKPAAEKLERLLKKYQENITISGPVGSVSEAVNVLKTNIEEFDLIFLDIQLTDGISFSIFDSIEIIKPVIFTTAYNEYALKAFKLNSIDYILKPYTYDDIKTALDKYYRISEASAEKQQGSTLNLEMLKQLIGESGKQYKSRFMVRKGEKIKALEIQNIKAFYADDRDVFILSDDNRRYSLNHKLEEVEQMVNPEEFFRVNRTFLVRIGAINEIIAYSNSRLKLDVGFNFDKEIIVSREKVSTFKQWMEGEL